MAYEGLEAPITVLATAPQLQIMDDVADFRMHIALSFLLVAIGLSLAVVVQVTVVVDLSVQQVLPTLFAAFQQLGIVQIPGTGQHKDQTPVAPVVAAVHRVQRQRRLAAETPERILADESDVGPVWVSELKFAQDAGDAVSGSTMPDEVNVPVVYSVAFLATLSNKHRKLAEDFVDFLLGDATQIYVDGGFLPLLGDELAERYSFDREGNLVIENFVP